MSINDFVEITTFLYLICFSIYLKIQGFVDECVFCVFYAESQDGRQKWRENDFWRKWPVDCRYPAGQKFMSKSLYFAQLSR